MNEIKERDIHCPYCGERINVLIDCSVTEQSYIEDCQVCCRPINFRISIEEGDMSIVVLSENE